MPQLMPECVMEPQALQKALRQALDIRVTLAISTNELDPVQLTPGEKEQFLPLQHGHRRSDWLKGRAALRQLLAQLGREPNTAFVRFPDREFTLTHSNNLAIALHAKGLDGIGIDFETERSINPKAVRFFLTEPEQDWLQTLEPDLQQQEMIRLWTVKEALFKADPDNANTRYVDYLLTEPGRVNGNASRPNQPELFMQYCSLKLPEGFLSVAINRREKDE